MIIFLTPLADILYCLDNLFLESKTTYLKPFSISYNVSWLNI